MRLLRLIKFMTMVTALALIYIHMQMQIFSLAYQGKNKEKRITQLKEDNSTFTYNILELKSSNSLGGKLLAEDSGLKFRDQGNVIQLVTARPLTPEQPAVSEEEPAQQNPLLSFLTFRAPAEASAEEKRSNTRP